jgi:hypothetical protein
MAIIEELEGKRTVQFAEGPRKRRMEVFSKRGKWKIQRWKSTSSPQGKLDYEKVDMES